MEFLPLTSLASAHLLHTRWGNSEPLRRLTQLAYRNEARSVVSLQGTECKQWKQEYGALYGDIADHLQGDPSLLLFVRGTVKAEEDLRDAAGKDDVVGYATLRPLPLGSIVEGFIVPKSTSDVHYITCQSDITLDLPGTGEPLTLSLKGLPFMQQDGVVSRCADASLWIATALISGAHSEWKGCQIVTHDLVSEALQYSPALASRRLPSGGLGFSEMMLTLERHGYDPIPYVFANEEDKSKSDHIIYRWVESGIPVILCLELEKDEAHTVVVCGHTFDPDAWWPGARTDYFPRLASEDRWLSSSLWAVQYLVVDDNHGPALAMTRGSLRNRTFAAIVPLPKTAKVYLAAEDAETIVANLIFGARAELIQLKPEQQTPWLAWLKSAAIMPDQRFVIRTLLARGADASQHLQKAGYSQDVAALAKGLSLPDTVWLSEISLPAIYGDKLKIGEVILDPKVPGGFHKYGIESLLWVNLVGQVWTPSVAEHYAGFDEPVELFARWLGK